MLGIFLSEGTRNKVGGELLKRHKTVLTRIKCVNYFSSSMADRENTT